MSILVAVITVISLEYKSVQSDAAIAAPIRIAVIGTTGASVFAGALALIALIRLRLGTWSTNPLAWAFGILIVIMTIGIVYVVSALIA
jgi:hypothetical protein